MKSIVIALSFLISFVATAQAQEITQQPTRYKPTVEAPAPTGPNQRYVAPVSDMSKGQSHRYSSAKPTKHELDRFPHDFPQETLITLVIKPCCR